MIFIWSLVNNKFNLNPIPTEWPAHWRNIEKKSISYTYTFSIVFKIVQRDRVSVPNKLKNNWTFLLNACGLF